MRRRSRSRGDRVNSYARRERASDYMAWVRTQSCVAQRVTPPNRHWQQVRCDGPVQGDHAGVRIAGLGTKSLDRDVIPLCMEHHRQRTEYDGVFANQSRDDLAEWRSNAIADTHARARSSGVEVPTC